MVAVPVVVSVVGALEEVLVEEEEAEALEALLEAATKAPLEAAGLVRPRPRPPAAASPPEPLRAMSGVFGTFSISLPVRFLCPY